jgi:hypothetical protein
VEQFSRLDELWMLLANRPDSAGREQNRGSSALKRSLEDSFPAWFVWSGTPAHWHVGEHISRPRLTLVKLEVGHDRFGCTPRAMPGMEIAPSFPLPASPASRYTAIE